MLDSKGSLIYQNSPLMREQYCTKSVFIVTTCPLTNCLRHRRSPERTSKNEVKGPPGRRRV